MSRRVIHICAWCPRTRIRILGIVGLALAPGEKLTIQLDENTGRPSAVWTTTAAGEVRGFAISHGICPECQAAQRALPARVM